MRGFGILDDCVALPKERLEVDERTQMVVPPRSDFAARRREIVSYLRRGVDNILHSVPPLLRAVLLAERWRRPPRPILRVWAGETALVTTSGLCALEDCRSR